MPASQLVCVDPARIHEVWPHVRPLLERACRATCLNAFADFEADILSGRSLVWITWNGRAIEATAATTLINSDFGKVCVITLCAGHGMQRWLKLIERIESYARDEGCARIRIFGRKGWLRVLERFEARHVVMDKLVAQDR
jgi:GNAT superfamily N-acetyltransferase